MAAQYPAPNREKAPPMMTLTEYFVRHYTLVIDTDQSSYHNATAAGIRVVRNSDITRAEWLALSPADRVKRFADDIGSQIMDMIESYCEDALTVHDTHPGVMLMREIMIFSDSDIGYALGAHYMPEDSDVADLLDDSDDQGGDE